MLIENIEFSTPLIPWEQSPDIFYFYDYRGRSVLFDNKKSVDKTEKEEDDESMNDDSERIVLDKKMRKFIKSSDWIFAKTMPRNPHWYILRANCRKQRKENVFEEFVLFIRKYGYVQIFYNREYICYNIDGHRYWSMGAPLKETILINKAEIK